MRQCFLSKQPNLQLVAKQHRKSVARAGPKSTLPEPTQPILSASRPFAIVSKLFGRGDYIGDGWGPWGIGVHAAFLVDVATLAAARLCLFPDSLRSVPHNSMPSDTRGGDRNA
jgi:hypothetical protein